MTGAPILLCFDGSRRAAEAIRGAGALLAGSEALVLAVAIRAQDELTSGPGSDLVGRLTGLYRDWNEIAGELAEQQAQAGCEIAAEAGLHASGLTAFGRPAPTILRVADEHSVAVIVLGARHHGAVGSMLGSVSARVVALATRAVLVIPGG